MIEGKKMESFGTNHDDFYANQEKIGMDTIHTRHGSKFWNQNQAKRSKGKRAKHDPIWSRPDPILMDGFCRIVSKDYTSVFITGLRSHTSKG